ncbi:hypothetical protein K7X08_010658 [Anisodus acutangulus]|uniref:Uncharacterized protein n=1 Tax=Anisodus acutangulus TaxID=402998 RepID=A0A9Q1M259_9SOLA|nr:hypothetical protein K7X08_010658 [Anisodus acutangulus]
MEKWTTTLAEAANLSGWDLQNIADGHESKFIESDKLVVLDMRESDIQEFGLNLQCCKSLKKLDLSDSKRLRRTPNFNVDLGDMRCLKSLAASDTVIIGEGANFAAYAYGPAILVTPLVALSMIVRLWVSKQLEWL